MSVYIELRRQLPAIFGRVIDKKSEKPRWAMVIDLRKCIGCYACQASCKMENGVPYEFFRTHVEQIERGRYPNVRRAFLPVLCNHCEKPSCVPVCPVGATYKREDGIVVIDYDRCIGCGYCIQACPYDARYFNPYTRTADKCDFCLHRIEQGLVPACVANCRAGARIFGDLNHPDSPVSKALKEEGVAVLKPETGNEPHVFYIGLEQAIPLRGERVTVVSPKIGVVTYE